MKLSIIIVNYNVKFFLEQALRTCITACRNIDAEIYVVDNNSIDDSNSMVKDFFPGVHLIESNINLGFAKANNIAIKKAKGEFILLLNPDTIVGEDCFIKCLQFMESHEDCGALTVKMIDGSGSLLPESKRGFPTLWAAICKFSGLWKFFPNSKLFNAYYHGDLSYDEIQSIDVLPGAFVFVRKTVIENIGMLDEAYFMYGEDIDFSYRIKQGGYNNYYLPDPQIIHYKGESSSKSSLNYIKTFYNAMIIFTNKYYAGINKFGLLLLLKIAIVIQGIISFVKYKILFFVRPIIDFIFLYFGINIIAKLWGDYYYQNAHYFPKDIFSWNAATYAIIWVFIAFFNGFYDKSKQNKIILMTSLSGLLINLILYSILPESFRTSRVIIFLSGGFTLAYLFFNKLVLNLFFNKSAHKISDSKINLAIVGTESDASIVKSILDNNRVYYSVEKIIEPSNQYSENQLRELLHILKIDEVIFASKEMNMSHVFNYISKIGSSVRYKTLSHNTQSIISSDSKHTQGSLIHFNMPYRLADHVYRRQKRIFDILFSIFCLIFFPILIFLQRSYSNFFSNIFSILIGSKTWVAYPKDFYSISTLPLMKPSVLSVLDNHVSESNDAIDQFLLTSYAQNYSVWLDLNICLTNMSNLHR